MGAQLYPIREERGRVEVIPYVRLRGRWLNKLGFDVGSRLKIDAEHGRITLTVEVAAGLRARFQEAAAREHRAADQVLGRLMRKYVAGECGPAAVDDRNLEEWVHHQHGWRCSPSVGD